MFAKHCRTTSLRIALTCVVIAQLFAALPVRAAPLNTFAPVPYTLTLQLDASTGIDTYIYSGSKNTNYGSVIETGIGEENTSSNQVARSLIKFDLSSIPTNATITESPTQSPSPTNPLYHISLPLNLNNEAGDFSQYTSFETDSGDLTVSPQAGLAGTGYGLSVLVDDSNRAYAYSAMETPSITGVIRARFYVDPNGLGMEELSQVSFIYFISSGASNAFATMKLMRIKGDYYLRGVMVDDNEVHQETEAWQVTDEPHYVEIRVRRSSGAEAEDATYETWIDGVARTTMTGVDSYEKFVDFKDVSAGLNGIAGSVSGTYYIDEIAVNDDGSEIGPVDELNPTQTPSDVPPTHPYYKDIEILYANGYTAGCNTNPLRFCPDQIMNRAESAVFMMRGAFGAGYSPNPTANLFEDSDWSRGTWARPWTEAMREAGMTAGCKLAPLLYCPWVPLSREQAVIFALRMKYGNTYAPPAGTGSVFEDVEDPNNWSTPWIEKAYADGLIPDCGTANSGKPLFCPVNLVSRGLAAYMIVRAKDLSMP